MIFYRDQKITFRGPAAKERAVRMAAELHGRAEVNHSDINKSTVKLTADFDFVPRPLPGRRSQRMEGDS